MKNNCYLVKSRQICYRGSRVYTLLMMAVSKSHGSIQIVSTIEKSFKKALLSPVQPQHEWLLNWRYLANRSHYSKGATPYRLSRTISPDDCVSLEDTKY